MATAPHSFYVQVLIALLAIGIALLPETGAAQEPTARPRAPRSEFAPSRTPPPAAVGADDRQLDCETLRKVVTGLIDQLKRLRAYAQIERDLPPTTMARMVARWQGPPGAGLENAEKYPPVRLRTDTLAALHAEKGCGRIDVAALLATLEAPPRTTPDRCHVRTDLDLEDCVEDISQWRCRSFAGKGRAYLECLEKVAVQVIAASGFVRSRLAHYAPDCTDYAYAPATCSVFSNDRGGPGTKWCKRVDERAIEECDVVTPGTARPVVARPSGAQRVNATPIPPKDATKTNCHRIDCGLGTCNRLCAPPI